MKYCIYSIFCIKLILSYYYSSMVLSFSVPSDKVRLPCDKVHLPCRYHFRDSTSVHPYYLLVFQVIST